MDGLIQIRQSPSMPVQPAKPGPPYPPQNASLGGSPTKSVDIPISAVFLVLFIIGATAHMTILQLNTRRGHKFLISGLLFGFCMARILAHIMRIVWACHPLNIRIAIAAQVFVAAGVVLLFIVNLIFAQRIVRAGHPRLGWHPVFRYAFVGAYVCIVITLVMLITSVIQSFYTLNRDTRRIDRGIQLYGGTFYAVVSFLPIPVVVAGLLVPRKQQLEKFGEGRWREKIAILLTSSVLLCLGASFRIGVNYAAGARRISQPASYQSKACFYIFNYAIEYIVVIAYVIVRVDRKFWVPNKSHGPGDYSRKEHDLRKEEEMVGETRGEGKLSRTISPEEDTFDDMTPEEVAKLESRKTRDEERGVEEATA